MNKLMMLLKTQVAAWSPADITTYAWIDPSDISSLYQDSSGTTAVTSDGDAIGRASDKSGNGRHATQSTTSAKPTFKNSGGIKSILMDGTSDILPIPTDSNLTTGMDIFMSIKRVSADKNVAVFRNGDNQQFAAVMQSGSTFACDQHAGSPTYYVDGAQVSPANRGTLDTAMSHSAWHVLELRGVNGTSLFGTSGFSYFSYFVAGFASSAHVGGIVLCPGLSTENRNKLRTWMGAKVGLTL